jgi:hypothetical protein
MKKVVLSAALTIALASTSALAADLKAMTKAPPPPPPPPAWDIAFGAAILSDYNFRGISQSNRQPAVGAYFEPRYNVTPDLQLYAGISGYSIEFPNRAAAEIDFYGGIRPTFGKLALDFGAWYYWYPNGQCFNASPPGSPDCAVQGFLPNGNVIKKDLSFWEVYAKAQYTFNEYWAAGAAVFYDPNWLNSGADGTWVSGSVKFTGAALPNGIGWYVSGEVGHYWFGTTDAFYAVLPTFPAGFPLPDYTAWNIGIGLTWKVFTLDFRYFDSDVSKSDCNALTGDHTAVPGGPSAVTAINPAGLVSKWCGAAFVVALKADLTVNSNLK